MFPLILLAIISIPNEVEQLRPLLDATRFKESTNGNFAIGDNGASKGPYQCQRAAWQDACEFGGVNWNYDKYVWDRKKSEQIFYWYTERYGARTYEERSRCWVSGPRWRKKYVLSNKYWSEIKKLLYSTNQNYRKRK